HDTRIIRLLEVLLHGGNTVGGWTAKQIHAAVLSTFPISASAYRLNQLRYDLRVADQGLVPKIADIPGSLKRRANSASGSRIRQLPIPDHERSPDHHIPNALGRDFAPFICRRSCTVAGSKIVISASAPS